MDILLPCVLVFEYFAATCNLCWCVLNVTANFKVFFINNN